MPSAAYERIQAARVSIESELKSAGRKPRVGIVLGSGLGPLAETIEDPLSIPYDAIEDMPSAGVHGHAGKLIFGKLGGTEVACLSGRAHLYEGHEPDQVVFGVRLLAALGVQQVILSNAAGGIADDLNPGTLMLISDHLNLTGRTPLLGPNEEKWGPRFPDMSNAYSPKLRSLAQTIAEKHGTQITQGVYAGVLGPTYETPAEIEMLERLGASAVGMSTVLETIALRHQAVDVLGISCVTNRAAGKSTEELSHDDVARVAGRTSEAFVSLVTDIVRQL